MKLPIVKNLNDLDALEFKSFLDSFDHILCDFDGVIWRRHNPIKGAASSLSKLQQIGKRVALVTNNCSRRTKHLCQILNDLNVSIKGDDIAYPTTAIIHYLTKINFDKEIFVIGCAALKEELLESGFKLADTGPAVVGETLADVKHHLIDNQDIGAVVFDLDLNMTYLKLAKAAIYLKRPNVLYITGASDCTYPVGKNNFALGPRHFQEILQNSSRREMIHLGKPGNEFKAFVKEKFNIVDASRVLFIGDSLREDILFAKECGYQTLLVLTGKTTCVEELSKQDTLPDFYINSLSDLPNLI